MREREGERERDRERDRERQRRSSKKTGPVIENFYTEAKSVQKKKSELSKHNINKGSDLV